MLLELYMRFAARRYASAVLRCRRVSVCSSFVRLSQAGVQLKWLNVGSRKQRHTTDHGLEEFSDKACRSVPLQQQNFLLAYHFATYSVSMVDGSRDFGRVTGGQRLVGGVLLWVRS